MVRIVKYGVCIMNDSKNSFDDVIDIFQEVFGWDATQAANCAYTIHNRGEYVIKWFDDERSALLVAQVMKSEGLSTKLIIDRNAQLD